MSLSACITKTERFQSEYDFLGMYEMTTGSSNEVIELLKDNQLQSIFQTRYFTNGKGEWIKFYEDGIWTNNRDTLIIERKRNNILNRFGYLDVDSFLIRNDTLIAIERDYMNQIYITNDHYIKY